MNKGFDDDQENTTQDLIQIAEPIRTSAEGKDKQVVRFLDH